MQVPFFILSGKERQSPKYGNYNCMCGYRRIDRN